MSVQDVDSELLHTIIEFQYILCVGSSFYPPYFLLLYNVSIHPMCRFKLSCIYSTPYLILVSIHPMCRFKTLFVLYFLNYSTSFNTSYVSVQDISNQVVDFSKVFQYILCVGSSIKPIEKGTEPDGFQYILCVGSSSIFLIL